jgi:predicted ribosome quality control (RQC) complex YloA/Tae2 family protein
MDGLAIAASLQEVRAVEGGVLRSIHQPTRSAFVLHVFAGRNRRILLAPRHAAIHLTRLNLPNPPGPSPFVMLLRRHLRGGRILAVRQRGWDRVVTFDIERREGRTTRVYRLVAELVGVSGNLFLLEGGKVLGSAHRDRRNRPGDAYVSLRPQDKLDPNRLSAEVLADLLRAKPAMHVLTRSLDGVGRQTAEDILRGLDTDEQAGAICVSLQRILACVEEPSPRSIVDEARATFYPLPPPAEAAGTFGEALDAVSAAFAEKRESTESTLRSDLHRAIARRTRTLEKLREWLDNAEEAESLQSLADLVMIHHSEIEPKSEQVVLIDPMTGREETIRLLASLSAIENAQRLYERAKRLRRGRPHVTSRIERLERETRLLGDALDDHDRGQVIDDRAAALLPGIAERKVAAKRGTERHRIQAEGFTILIGRSALENDRLLRDAAPDDLWLHARGFAGSHVIIRRGGRREIPETVVRQAAKLAARYSKARDERRVQVVVTQAKHARKPRGSAPGLANVLKGDTLTVEL